MIHEQAGGDPYTEALNVQGAFALFGAPGETPILQGTNNSPAITVAAAGTLFARGLTISGTPNTKQGLLVSGGQAWVAGCSIVNNTGGGIAMSGGSLTLTNSFIGGDVSDQLAVEVTSGTVDIRYATIAAGFGAAAALSCTDGSTTSVRNSLLVARTGTDELMCAGATITNNALEMDAPGNASLGDMANTSWFFGFAQGDFHLSGTHPAAIEQAATWMTGDPTTDIDGTARPDTDGAMDVAGADIP